MKIIIRLTFFIICLISFGQNKNPVGEFENNQFKIKFNDDNTFNYTSKYFQDPIGNNFQDKYIESGKWILRGDTIILNQDLTERSYGHYDLIEDEIGEKGKVYFRFNLIKTKYNENDEILSIDTLQIEKLDLAINNNDKKNRLRISNYPTTRCAFAGYIPKELITDKRVFEFEKKDNLIHKIYIGSYELKKTEEFIIKNPNSNSFVLNVYQNIYENAMIRNKKYLMLNKNTILIEQKPNGKYKKDGMYFEYYQIKRNK
ncbi:MAG TPA: hypothetical protein DEQ26_10445 [Flavobacteriaceae bacterium]|nr:hypothetical protein [Flavobacteriaceae bacterium]